MRRKEIEELVLVVVGMAGFFATWVYLTVFDGPHPQSVLGWLWEGINNVGLSVFWPFYWPFRLIAGY